MAQKQFNCRLDEDIAKWIADEAARLTKSTRVKHSQADVITQLVIRHGKPQPRKRKVKVK